MALATPQQLALLILHNRKKHKNPPLSKKELSVYSFLLRKHSPSSAHTTKELPHDKPESMSIDVPDEWKGYL